MSGISAAPFVKTGHMVPTERFSCDGTETPSVVSATVVIGGYKGDEGKGKVVKGLINGYGLCVRFNGGPNAGHTTYCKNKSGTYDKVILHQIPCGILAEKFTLNIIGPQCYVDEAKLNAELNMIEKYVPDARHRLLISYNAHVILPEHIERDKSTNVIGTTGSGMGPVAADKVLRKGKRVEDFAQKFGTTDIRTFAGCVVVDPTKFINEGTYKNYFVDNVSGLVTLREHKFNKILFEGAQGYFLDIDSKCYPYVTTGNMSPTSVASVGYHLKESDEVIAIMKLYDTYVGTQDFQSRKAPYIFDDDEQAANYELLCSLQKIGREVGSTTGRGRQCNWLNLDDFIEMCRMCKPTTVIFNKCDVVRELGVYQAIHNGTLVKFEDINQMYLYIVDLIKEITCVGKTIECVFSSSPFDV